MKFWKVGAFVAAELLFVAWLSALGATLALLTEKNPEFPVFAVASTVVLVCSAALIPVVCGGMLLGWLREKVTRDFFPKLSLAVGFFVALVSLFIATYFAFASLGSAPNAFTVVFSLALFAFGLVGWGLFSRTIL